MAQTVVEIPDDEPSGLGWLADGRLLVVGMMRRVVYRLEADGSLRVHADLSSVARGVLNDMIVSADGRAYVGDMGMDPNDPGAGMRPGQLLCIEPDGSFSTVADDLGAPNGPALTEDGRTLILAESSAFQLSRFTIGVRRHLVGARGLRHGSCCSGRSRVRAAGRHLPGCCRCRLGRRPHRGAGRPPPGGRGVDPQRRLPGRSTRRVRPRRSGSADAVHLRGRGYRREAVRRQPLGRIDAVEVEVAGSGRP